MDRTVFGHRSLSSDQCLRGYLTAEDTRTVFVRIMPAKEIDLELLDIEKPDDLV
jgi:hypothetical protein